MRLAALAMLALTSAGGACSSQPAPPEPRAAEMEARPAANPEPAVKEPFVPFQPPSRQPSAGGAPVSGLPYAEGETFTSLDDYLAHLRRLGAYDVPYFVEIQPGVYEAVTGPRPAGPPPARYTREQLERRFGFRTD